MRSLRRMVIVALALCVAPCAARSAVTIERVTYHGWTGVWRMTNRTVDLVFVPQIGRIMRYGFVGGPNLLWENRAEWGHIVDPAAATGWTNFGGDKLWIAPQWQWRGDQDPYLDAGACKVTVLPGPRLRVAGPTSPNYGLRFVREIALSGRGTTVTLRNTLINAGTETAEWSVWEVTQVDNPEAALLPLTPGARFPLGFHELSVRPVGSTTVSHGTVEMLRDAKTPYKLGSASPEGYAAMRKNGVRMVVEADYNAHARYPDNGCAQEVYSNPDPLRYMELEMLGPLRRMAPRAENELVTRWRIERTR